MWPGDKCLLVLWRQYQMDKCYSQLHTHQISISLMLVMVIITTCGRYSHCGASLEPTVIHQKFCKGFFFFYFITEKQKGGRS